MSAIAGRRARASGSASVTFRRALAVLTVSLAVLATSPASAYVRYRSSSGCPYAWKARVVAISGYPQGMPDLDETQIGAAVTDAAHSWTQENPILAGCTDLSIDVTMKSLVDAPPEPKFDSANNVVFVRNWCAPPPGDCREPLALAITSVFAHTSGEIVDADVEVNADDFTWGDLVSTPSLGGRHDLQNALTHEMGHFIGMDHTCYDGKPGTSPPVDETGQPVPSCFDLDISESVRMTTMFASAEPGDVSKRTLEADDLHAVCAAYPRGEKDPLACGNKAGACAVVPSELPTPLHLWITATLALLALTSTLLRRPRPHPRRRS